MHRRLELSTALHVVPHDLLIMGDDAGLSRGRAILVDHDAAAPSTCRSQLLEEHPAAFVRTDDAAEIRLPSQSQDVIEDVGGAAEPQGFGVDMNHRHRGFRRDPAHTAPDIMIEDEIPDHEHGGLRKPRDVLPQYLRGCRTSAALSSRACRSLARDLTFTY